MKNFNTRFYPHIAIAACTLPALIISGCANNLETAYVKEGDEIIAIEETTVKEDNMALITLESSEPDETVPNLETTEEETTIAAVEEDSTPEETMPVIIATGNPEAYIEINDASLTEGGNSLQSLQPEALEVASEEVDHNEQASTALLEEATTVPPSHSTVFFSTNSSEISKEDMDMLVKHAEYLLNNPESILTINGHADNRGKIDYNLILSEKRARSVADILISMGVADSQLIINAFGDTMPTLELSNWQANRRVELNYEEPSMLSQR